MVMAVLLLLIGTIEEDDINLGLVWDVIMGGDEICQEEGTNPDSSCQEYLWLFPPKIGRSRQNGLFTTAVTTDPVTGGYPGVYMYNRGNLHTPPPM